MNYAARQAKGEFIALVNDDSIVASGWLDALLDTARRRPRAGLVAGKFLHSDGSLQEAGSLLCADGTTGAVGDGLRPGYMSFERRIEYGSAGLWLVRRHLWAQLGGLDEGFYPAYYEDVDFCLRAREAGWEIWYQPEAVVVHQRASSTQALFRSFLFERGHRRLLERWAHLLPRREPRQAIERGVWTAMGGPLRVLVIDDHVPRPNMGSGFGRMHDALSRLAADSGLHLAFFPRLGSSESTPFPVAGVRLISDLESASGDRRSRL